MNRLSDRARMNCLGGGVRTGASKGDGNSAVKSAVKSVVKGAVKSTVVSAVESAVKSAAKPVRALILVLLGLSLSGCEDPQVYGSVGMSTGYGGYGGYGGYYGGYRGWNQPRMHSSISIGGRIR